MQGSGTGSEIWVSRPPSLPTPPPTFPGSLCLPLNRASLQTTGGPGPVQYRRSRGEEQGARAGSRAYFPEEAPQLFPSEQNAEQPVFPSSRPRQGGGPRRGGSEAGVWWEQ